MMAGRDQLDQLHVLAEADDVSATTAARIRSVITDYDTLAFAATVDVVTFDHEHVPTQHLHCLATPV